MRVQRERRIQNERRRLRVKNLTAKAEKIELQCKQMDQHVQQQKSFASQLRYVVCRVTCHSIVAIVCRFCVLTGGVLCHNGGTP